VKPSRKRQAPAKTSTPPAPPSQESASTDRFGRKWWILLIALLLVFSTMRCAAAWKELWLDEIWALRIVEPLGSPLEIWTKVRIDNHCLYSLYLYFLDTSSANWIYRLPSLLAGLGSMVLVACISREQLRWNSRQPTAVETWATVIVSVLLLGCCHMNVHFDSEARGYSWCVCFCLLAFYCLLKGQTNRSRFLSLGYWAATGLGLLSHPIAIHMLIAGGIWSSWHVFRTKGSAKQTLLHVGRWHLVPWTAFLAFYFFYLRLLKSGGAADVSWLEGSSMAWCYTLGLPLQVGALAHLVGILLTAAALVYLIKQHNDLWVFYLIVVFISPLLLTFFRQSTYNYSRYFVVNTTMALLLSGGVLGHLLRKDAITRILLLAVLTLYVLGNCRYTHHLIRFGRGQYVEAIHFMRQNTASQLVTVAGDHDFRHPLTIGFHLKRFGLLDQFAYYRQDTQAASQWVILHGMEFDAPKPLQITDNHGNRFRLRQTYRSAFLSGFRLFLYEHER
jgi:hypothetical protein